MFGSVPDLLSFELNHVRWADRVAVVAVHQFTAPNLFQVDIGFGEVAAKRSDLGTRLPAKLVLDKRELGWAQRYEPDGLEDMVLLDPYGRIVARGERSKQRLETELEAIETSYGERMSELRGATTPEEACAALDSVLGLELPGAPADVRSYARGCRDALRRPVLEHLLQLGDYEPLVAALDGASPERRAAALEIMEAQLRPEWADILLDRAQRKGVEPEDIARMLRLALRTTKDPASVETVVLELTRRGPVSRRHALVPLLGELATPAAKDLALSMLAKAPNSRLRIASAEALVTWNEDAVRKALQDAASGDRSEDVRAAAKTALAALEAKQGDDR